MSDLNDLKRRFVEAGDFVRPFGKIVYLTPAFTIDEEDHGKLTSSIVSVLKELSRSSRD
jgi:adenosylmethionine-8-amino-7-oxononanoate aminotransferase